MHRKDVLVPIMAAAIIVLAVTSVFEYNTINLLNGELQSQTQSQTDQFGRAVYDSSAVVIPVGCCPSLPSAFVVGDPRVNTYVFDVSQGPIRYVHGQTVDYVSGGVLSFRVYQNNALPPTYQWANFTIFGTFNPNMLDHSNATLFDGGVIMNFFVNSSILYLRIVTR